MGFCVALRPQGQPCMCQSTAQLAAGTLQWSGLTYLRIPGQLSFDQGQATLSAITGGTGLYTGATGYFQELNPYPGPAPSGPAESAQGLTPGTLPGDHQCDLLRRADFHNFKFFKQTVTCEHMGMHQRSQYGTALPISTARLCTSRA